MRSERASQVVARWVSVKRAAGLLDVSVSLVRRLEAGGFFGAGNSAVIRVPGRTGKGALRIRARAVNAAMEALAEAGRREADRQGMAAGFLESRRRVMETAARMERPLAGMEVWRG